MAKKNQKNLKKYKQQPKKTGRQKKTVKKEVPEHWTFPQLDKFFSKHLNTFFYISLALTIIFGAYLFDLKISEGGDDSDYIVAAKHFFTGKSFPSWHGAFYPIFLSLFVAIAGVNLFVLKMVSFVAIVVHLVVFYFAFRRVISPLFLTLILLILGVNSHVLYYASQTYSEAFFMMLQMIAVLLMFKIVDLHIPDKINTQKNYLKEWLLLALVAFLIYQTRNIGVAILLTIIIFFLLERKFIHAAVTFAGFLVFAIPFKLYKNIVWNLNQANIRGQFELMFYKNPYNPAVGKEDFAGMFNRVIENAELYLSRQLMIILGFRQEGSKENNLFLAILIVAVLVVTLIMVYKRNKKIFFILLYTLIGIGATFVSLHAIWGQPRLILIYMPFILVSLAWLSHHLSKNKSSRYLKYALMGLFVFVFVKTLTVTAEKVKDHKKELEENFEGNRFYGFTQDWVNFLAMSEWVGQNIPDTAGVASRKPSMSFIYSKGREFQGIFKLPTLDVEAALTEYDSRFDDLVIVNLNNFIKKEMPMQLQFAYLRQSLAFVYDQSDLFGVFHLKTAKEELNQMLMEYDVPHWTEAEELISYVRNKDFSAASSDSLVYNLKEKNIDYIIQGSLRVMPERKTDRTINTVARYIYFVEMKYPGIFEKVYQIGEDDNEPAKLFKVNYSTYNIR